LKVPFEELVAKWDEHKLARTHVDDTEWLEWDGLQKQILVSDTGSLDTNEALDESIRYDVVTILLRVVDDCRMDSPMNRTILLDINAARGIPPNGVVSTKHSKILAFGGTVYGNQPTDYRVVANRRGVGSART
jgi:hypothetical protein